MDYDIELLKNKYQDKIDDFNTLKEVSLDIKTVKQSDDLIKLTLNEFVKELDLNFATLIYDNAGKIEVHSDGKYITDKEVFAKQILTSEIMEWMCDGVHKLKNNVKHKEYKFLQQKGIKSFVFIPAREYGGFVLGKDSAEFFTTERISVLESITDYIIVALENAIIREKMEKVATKDGLTDLYNRVYFEEKVGKDEELNDKYKLALISIENLDNLVNHENEVIKTFSEMLKKQFRNRLDDLYRYDRKTFALVVEDVNLKSLYLILEDFRKRFVMETFRIGNKLKKYNAAIGVATFEECIQKKNYLYLVNRAEEALKYSKLTGANATCIYNSKLQLLVNSEKLIKEEIKKSKRYKWELHVFYITVDIDATVPNREVVIDKIDEIVETTVKGADMYFKSHDNKYLIVTHDKMDIEVLVAEIKNKYYKSPIREIENKIEVQEYYYPEDNEDFITKLKIKPRRIS